MPIEFFRETCTAYGHYTVCNSTKLVMAYDGSGRRISKTRSYIEKDILRLSNGGAILPKRGFGASRQGLGRYGIENTDGMAKGDEFYLKNHLGSTMMVAQVSSTNASEPAKVAAAYDYRSFGEQVTLTKSADKVTENFTGKELDDETALDYFGARYLDPMLGMWTSVDPARQFASPYLYAGNGMNPVNVVDPDGNETKLSVDENGKIMAGMSRVDDGNNVVTVTFANGNVQTFAEPPLDSYFFTEDLTNQAFDPNMQSKAEDMLNLAFDAWPCDAPAWGTGGELDFKNAYYGKAHNTVGVLNGTIMTARDAGNAMWGGWTKHMYVMPYFLSRFVANAVAVKSDWSLEDPQSSSMQIWGYANFKP